MVPLEKLVAGAQEHRSQTGRPLVTLSYAQSLDGCIAARPGEKLALSGSESMQMTHQLRAMHDAILVGIGTLLADDPRLTVRLVQGQDPQPIVMDSHLRIPLEAGLLQNTRRPWIACLEDANPKKSAELEALGVNLLHISADSAGCVSAPALLERLAHININSLMVEGGARVISTFLQHKLVDRIVLTVAPVFLGGLRAVSQHSFAAQSGPPGLYPRLQEVGVEQLGRDLVIWGNLNAGV
jgi:3,4-dihydroxy 2-butanone 4-phosphate synthase/GTP cyclohydrolase II